jgi:hypothetical protein
MKINLSNLEKLEKTLINTNGRSAAFTITEPEDLPLIAQQAEKKLLARGVKKKNLPGTKVDFTPSGPTASSYKYSAKSTRVVMLRGAKSWYLVKAEETTVYPNSPEKIKILISEATQQNIIQQALHGIELNRESI